MFERFTDAARAFMVEAQDAARSMGHNYIGTEHYAVALAGEPKTSDILTELGLTAEKARADVEVIVGTGDTAITGQIPFTPRAKKVLELALREALSLGSNTIDTVHILLGFVREQHGTGMRVFRDNGIDEQDVRNAVIQSLSGSRGKSSDAPTADYLGEGLYQGKATKVVVGSKETGELPPAVSKAIGESLERSKRITAAGGGRAYIDELMLQIQPAANEHSAEAIIALAELERLARSSQEGSR